MTKKRNYKKHLTTGAITITLFSFLGWTINISINKPEFKKPAAQEQYLPTINDNKIQAIAFPVDGDSIKIGNKEQVRLINVDAPEYKQKCLDKDGYEYNCGEVSATFLNKLIRGKNIDCYYQKKDIYNRYLAVCYLGEININNELVKNGMAIIYNVSEASAELKGLEKEARSNKVGIWRGSFLEPKEYRKKNKNKKHER